MNITDTQIAIPAILVAAGGALVYAYVSGNPVDSGIIYTAIAAISGLAGFDMGKKAAA